MGKILAIIFLVVFAWFAIPQLAKGLWFAPTLYPDSWWGEHIVEYEPQVASQGFGWSNFDIRKDNIGANSQASALDSLYH